MLGRAEAQLFEFMLIAEVMMESEKPLRALEPAHPGQRSYMAACVALGPRGILYSGNQELRDRLQDLGTAVFTTMFGNIGHRAAFLSSLTVPGDRNCASKVRLRTAVDLRAV